MTYWNGSTGVIETNKKKKWKKNIIENNFHKMQAQGNVTNYIKVPSFSYACLNPCITLVKCIIKEQVRNVFRDRQVIDSFH